MKPVLKKGLLCLLLMIIFLEPVRAIELTAEAAVVIDSVTGAVIYGKNQDARLGMASTTKIMTGILAIENGNMQDVVTVGKNACNVEGSAIYLKEGEKITFETLVYGLLLKSGNDAAMAIAEHISGSVPAFVKLMNDKAKELGLKSTSFANPHGLYDPNHYTTAYELALIGRYAMKNPTFEKIVNTANYRETPPESRTPREIHNANKLISMYAEADGIKPGYTPETGRTLVGSATKDGWRVITVTLNCRDDWNEHKKMFDYAFQNYHLQKIMKKGAGVGTFRVSNGVDHEVGVVAGADIYAPVKNGEEKNYQINIQNTELTAPVQDDQVVGQATITLAGGQKATVELRTNSGVDP